MSSIKAYKEIVRKLDFKGRVIYPCCGYDSQPSEVFDEVIYIDKNEDAVKELTKKSLIVFKEDIKDIKMDCDLLIIINPSISAIEVLKSFNCKFVFCNNLHGTADELRSLNFTEEKLEIPDYFLFRNTI